MKFGPILLLMPLLTTCGGDADTPTAEENRQLDEAADLLNEAPANLDAVDDYGVGERNDSPPGQSR